MQTWTRTVAAVERRPKWDCCNRRLLSLIDDVWKFIFKDNHRSKTRDCDSNNRQLQTTLPHRHRLTEPPSATKKSIINIGLERSLQVWAEQRKAITIEDCLGLTDDVWKFIFKDNHRSKTRDCDSNNRQLQTTLPHRHRLTEPPSATKNERKSFDILSWVEQTINLSDLFIIDFTSVIEFADWFGKKHPELSLSSQK